MYCILGCSDFNNSIFLKVREVQNKILRPVYKKHFSIFCSIGCIVLQSFQKVLKGLQKIFLKKIKIGTKNADLLDKLQKNAYEKSYSIYYFTDVLCVLKRKLATTKMENILRKSISFINV